MKKFYLPALVLASLAIFSLNSLRAEVREWTQSATGKKLKAEFVKMKDDKTVTIRMAGGRTHDVPVASLSEADRTYIKEKNAAAPADSKKPIGKKGDAPELPEGEVTVVLSEVHLCCGGCVKAIEKVNENKKYRIEDVKIKADRKEKTVTIEAPTGIRAQRALAGILSAGYYGKSDHDVLQIKEARGKGTDFKSNIMTVRDIHMCCGGCIKAAKGALKEVEGVEEYEIEEGDTQFYVKGKDFKPYEVMMALRAVGFGGKSQ